MEIDQLLHFLKVAELQNMTRAAEALGLSQPAVSRSIQKLEEGLGQPLFERQTRKVVLTDAGKFLQKRSRQVLTLIEETENEIADDGESGCIRVGAIPTIAPYFLPQILRSFATDHPKSRVLIQEDTTQNLLNRLTQSEVDIAILALPIASKHLSIEVLFEEELLLVLSKNHPLVAKEQVRLTDLREQPFVLLDEAHCLSDAIVSFCRHRSIQPVSMERTSQLVTIQELVALDHGISLIPAMARELDKSPRRVYRSLSGTKPKRVIIAAWNPYRYQSKLMQSFLRHLKEARPNAEPSK